MLLRSNVKGNKFERYSQLINLLLRLFLCCVLTLKVINSRGIHNGERVRHKKRKLRSNVKGNKFERYSQPLRMPTRKKKSCVLTLKVINSRGIHNGGFSTTSKNGLRSNVKGNKFERYSQLTNFLTLHLHGCVLTLKVINSRGIHNRSRYAIYAPLLRSNVKGNKFERYSQR